MSIQDNKVVFEQKLRSRKGFVWFLTATEIILTLVLGVVIATTKIFAPSADSAQGVINKLSYQGRLTDTSGNALGGSGTNYCFRFSIYDASSSGNLVWPAATPATTTLSVVDGVFNADIGSADTLDFNFYPTSTTFLNVEVNTVTSTCTGTWETLTPRQAILATGYSIAAENVYGDLLRTDVASSIVQVGTGGGVSSSSVKKLALDVANTAENIGIGATCSINGTVWYNSNASNTQALLCEGGFVHAITGHMYRNFALPTGQSGPIASARAPLAASGGWQHMAPFRLEADLSATRAAVIFSIAGASTTNTSVRSNQITVGIGIFSRGSGTSTASLYAASSASSTWSWSWASTTNSTTLAQVTGWRRFNIPLTINAEPGDYWYGLWFSQAQSITGSGAISLMAVEPYATSNVAFAGNIGSTTNSSRQAVLGHGVFSSNTTAAGGLVTSMALTDIKAGLTAGSLTRPWVLLTSFDLN